jgi:hypothetical protein
MRKTTQGIVHGRTIELNEDLGLAEGQKVEIFVKIVTSSSGSNEGLRRCAGSLADDWTGEDDRILDEIHRERKQDARRDVAE